MNEFGVLGAGRHREGGWPESREQDGEYPSLIYSSIIVIVVIYYLYFKKVVLHDFTPCVDDELEVKRGQVGWWTFRHLNHHPFIIALSPSSPSSFSSLYKRVNIDVPDDKESQFLNSEALPRQPTTRGGANTIFPPSDNNF